MTSRPCPACGADVGGSVCEYCGSRLDASPDLAAEKAALQDFHAILAAKDPDAQGRLLRNGFLPDHTEVLLEAGLRCVALISDSDMSPQASDGAAQRLDAIVAKLRILPASSESSRGLAIFEERLKKYRKAQDRYGFWGCVVVILLVGGVAGLAYVAVRFLLRLAR